MTTPHLGRECQINQGADRPVRTQHRIGKIEQRVRSRRQAVIKLGPEPGQHPECTGRAGIMHTDHLKPLVLIFQLSQEGMINQGLHP